MTVRILACGLMRVLFDIGHPAHVHLFRHAIGRLANRMHTVLVTASDKDVTTDLLQNYGIPFVLLGELGRTTIGKGVGLMVTGLKLAVVLALFQPDLVVGVSPARAAPIAWICRRTCVAFDDTEHAHWARRLYMPFVSAVMTPSWFGAELGRVQIRYDGFHEIAYLHPKYFVPDSTVLAEEGLSCGEPFSVVRFVSVTASHDRHHVGFSVGGRERLVSALARHGRVIISSEVALPSSLENYHMRGSTSSVHHLLAFASVYVGDGATMTTEAALLGTPAVFYGSVGPLLANFQHLENGHALVRRCLSEQTAIECAASLLCDPEAKRRWIVRKQRLVASCTDLTDSIVRLVETAGSCSSEFSIHTARSAFSLDTGE